jgi:hypothetical protein
MKCEAIPERAATRSSMSKTLLYRLFGIGKIPGDALQQIHKEGVVLITNIWLI